MSTAAKITLKQFAVVVWISSLIIVTFLVGCERRRTVESTPGMDRPERFWVRVLLFQNNINAVLSCKTGYMAVNPETETAANYPQPENKVNITVKNGKITVGHRIIAPKVIIKPRPPFVFTIDGKSYRGNLELSVNPDEKCFTAVNLVPLEGYLAGVVGAEMPDYWESEALKAQTIAARTYCLHIKKKFGSDRSWDVKRTQAHQVYKGLSAESVTVWEAVRQTEGIVLVAAKEDGTEAIFPTYYNSTCGGHTEDSINVFGDSWGPLKGVPCPYCRDVAKKSVFYWSNVEFDTAHITESVTENYPDLKRLGSIHDIEPFKMGRLGRIVSVKLIGENGKFAVLRGEDFRLTVDPSGNKIKSALCKILKEDGKFKFHSGRGYGHGVGLCQCGAQALARSGKNAREILDYYYPTSSLKRLY